jgi:hypothetical protein
MKWRMYMCADCNMPEGVVIVQVEDDKPDDAGIGIDYCPGCGDYLSMCGMGEVEIEGAGALAQLTMRERDAKEYGMKPE